MLGAGTRVNDLDRRSLQDYAFVRRSEKTGIKNATISRLNIDNNRAERAIKPFVIGRKNWLFSNTARGAQASATLYSIIETAKANGQVPFDYLNRLFEELPKSRSGTDVSCLLPWKIKLF